MRRLAISLCALSVFFVTPAMATGLAATKRDCAEIMEQWANNPDSVPAHLVQGCQDMLAAAAGTPTPAPADDPCSDTAAASSVRCWGPWAALAPAAGVIHNPHFVDPDSYEWDQERMVLTDPMNPTSPMGPMGPMTPEGPMNPESPMGNCAAGAACGFALLDPGFCSEAEDHVIGHFELETDGSGFVFNRGEATEIASLDNLQPSSYNGYPGFERSDGTVESGFAGNFGYANDGSINSASGDWGHGTTGFIQLGANHTDRPADGGFYVWGVASTQATLDSLNVSNATVNFSGTLLRNTTTQVNMTVNFGSNTNWTGSWDSINNSEDFTAGGNVLGANLISDSSQFSANVDAGQSAIEGLLVGDGASQSLIHAIEIVLQDGTVIKDVGQLY